MSQGPTKKEIQHQLSSLAKMIDGADRLGHWVNDDLLENNPLKWRAKRLELEILLLNHELANVEAEIQRRTTTDES